MGGGEPDRGVAEPGPTTPNRPHPLSPFRLDPPPSRRDALRWAVFGGVLLCVLNLGVPYHAWIALTWTRAEGTITGATLREPTWWQPRRSHWIEFNVTLPDGRHVSGQSVSAFIRIRMLEFPYRTGADRMLPGQPPPIGAKLDVRVNPRPPHQVMPEGEFAPVFQVLFTPLLLVIFVRGLFHLRRRPQAAGNA